MYLFGVRKFFNSHTMMRCEHHHRTGYMSKGKGLFIKKTIKSLLDEAQDTKHAMKRSLGALSLTAMGIGAIIGAGIFVLTGPAAAEYAGPGILLSFVIAAVICVLAALCYA